MYGYNCGNNYEWQKRSFQGKADPEAYLSWEKRKEREFGYHEYSEQKKFKLAVLDFSDDARTWWAQFDRDRRKFGEHPIDTWEELKTVMRRRYAPVQPSRRNDYASPRHKEQPSRRSIWDKAKEVHRHEELQWRQRRDTPKAYKESVFSKEFREDIMGSFSKAMEDCWMQLQDTPKVHEEQDQPRGEDDEKEYAVQGELLGSNVLDEVHEQEEENTCESERQEESEQKIVSEKESESKNENEKKREIERKEDEKSESENKREKEIDERKVEQKEKERKLIDCEKESVSNREMYFEKPMTVHSYKTALVNTNEINSSLSSYVLSLIQVDDDIPRASIPYQSAFSISEETTKLPKQVGELMESNFIKAGIVEEDMSLCAIDDIIVPKKERMSSLCIDFELVNKYRYYFLCLDNMCDKLHSTCVLSTCDDDHEMTMPSRISVIDCDEWKIVLTCDLYRWIVISVRLTYASSIFMGLLKHVLHASIGKFVFSYFEGRIVFVINYGGYLIFVELVYDHDIYSRCQCSCYHLVYSRFQGAHVHEIHSRFSYPYVELGFHADQSLHDASLVDSGSDHVFILGQSSLHDLLLSGREFKSVYHQIGVRYDLCSGLVSSFRLAKALSVFILNHILHSFMEKFVIIYFDDIPGFINTCGKSIAIIEFECDHCVYAIEFSSCEVSCDLSIPLMQLVDFKRINVNGKGKVDFVLQIQDGFVLIGEKSLIRSARQFRQCVEYLQGSVLNIVFVDYACDFELFNSLAIRSRELIDSSYFVFNPGIQVCLQLCHGKFQRFIFDPGAIEWVLVRMIEIMRFVFDPGIRHWNYLRMDEIIKLVFDPGIHDWEYLLLEEFYVQIFDPGGYRTFHSFYAYLITYLFMFLGSSYSSFDCSCAFVTNLVCFIIGSNLEVLGLRVEERRDSVDKFLSKGDRKFKFPGCVTIRLQCDMPLRASLGRKHLRVVHVIIRQVPDVVLILTGVGVFNEYLHIFICIVDIAYIHYLQVEYWDYDLFDVINLIYFYVGSDLWANPFREEGRSDLRTNPFQEEGNDNIQTRATSNENESILDIIGPVSRAGAKEFKGGFNGLILSNWAKNTSKKTNKGADLKLNNMVQAFNGPRELIMRSRKLNLAAQYESHSRQLKQAQNKSNSTSNQGNARA